MTRPLLSLALLFGLASGLALAQSQPSRSSPPAADEAAIRTALDGYAAAMSKGDVDAVLALWAEGGEFIDEAGQATRGKKALAELFKKAFAEGKKQTYRVRPTSLRVPRADLALLDGLVEVAGPDGNPDRGAFSAVLTKTDGKWQILSARDLSADAGPPRAANPLQGLAWLVGDWGYEAKDSSVSLTARWIHQQRYLQIDYVFKVKNDEAVTLTQIVAWDPLRRQPHSWLFSSAGGFGESLWTRQGNEWTARSETILPDGRTATATNVFKYLDDNTFEWSSRDRDVDGQPSPDVKVRYTRQQKK